MRKDQNGTILLAIIIMMPLFMLIAASFMQLAVNNYQIARVDQYRTHAQFSVDAGIDATLEKINLNTAYTGTLGTAEADAEGEVELVSGGEVRRTYEVEVLSPDDDHKTIVSTGRTYFPTSSTTARSTVIVTAELRPVRSGEFSVVSGVGGLTMDNHAKILGGDVHVNGKVTMKNHAQIGQTISPVNLTVAHKSCPSPPDNTYPQICLPADSPGEPISIENDAHIYGNVRANNQDPNPAITNPGVTDSSGIVDEPLPPHDRNALTSTINAAAAGNSPASMTGSAAGCTSNTTKSWPANLKIIGNVEISKKCKLTVNGDVWISGNLTVDNNQTQMIVADSLNAIRPVIMVDGDLVKVNNSSTLKSNISGTGFYIITYKSDVSCTISAAGCDLSGNDLYNSKDDMTIELDNGAAGAETIFYAKWTKVVIKNSGQIGALIGQTVELSNSGAITFGASTGTSTEFWVIDSVRRTFN